MGRRAGAKGPKAEDYDMKCEVSLNDCTPEGKIAVAGQTLVIAQGL
jgi:hypothetical protein